MEEMFCGRVVERDLMHLCGTNITRKVGGRELMWKGGWEGVETFNWNQYYVERCLVGS